MSQNTAPPKARIRTSIFIGLVIFFILFRMAVLFTSLEIFDREEARMGTLGLDILRGGPTIPLLDFIGPPESHESGSIINGVIAAATYGLFGPSGVSLKLVWLAFATGTFILLLLTTQMAFGPRSAIFAGLLAIAGTPFFIFFNLTDTAVDTGALLLVFLNLFLFIRAIDTSEPEHRAFFLAGLFAGFSIFFSYHSIPMTFVCVVFGLLFHIRKLFRFIPALGSGFLIGLIPWSYFNITHDFWGIGYLTGQMSFDGGEKGLLANIGAAIGKGLFHLPGFSDFGAISGHLLGIAYYSVLPIAFVVFLYRAFGRGLFGRAAPVIMGAYPIVWILVYSASDFNVGPGPFREYRHMLSLMVFVFIAVGVTADWLLRQKNSARKFSVGIAVLILLIPIFCGLAGTAKMVRPGNLNTGPDSIYPSQSWHWLGFKVWLYADDKPDLLLPLMQDLANRHAPYDYPSAEWIIKDAGQIKALVDQLPEELSSALMEGLGKGIGRFGVQDVPYRIALRNLQQPDALAIGDIGQDPVKLFRTPPGKLNVSCNLPDLSANQRIPYCRGLGIMTGAMGIAGDSLDCSPCRQMPQIHSAFAEGYGFGLASDRSATPIAPPVQQTAFWQGVGMAEGFGIAIDKERIDRTLSQVPENAQVPFVNGIGQALGWHFLNDPTLLVRFELTFGDTLRPADQKHAREYVYLARRLHGLFWAKDPRAKSFLVGLGEGQAVHALTQLKLLRKVASKVTHYSWEDALYNKGAKAGLMNHFADLTPAREILARQLQIRPSKEALFLDQLLMEIEAEQSGQPLEPLLP